MKALSVSSFYAMQIMLGNKTIEWRTWCTAHRGELLICSNRERTPGTIPSHALCVVRSTLSLFPVVLFVHASGGCDSALNFGLCHFSLLLSTCLFYSETLSSVLPSSNPVSLMSMSTISSTIEQELQCRSIQSLVCSPTPNFFMISFSRSDSSM